MTSGCCRDLFCVFSRSQSISMIWMMKISVIYQMLPNKTKIDGIVECEGGAETSLYELNEWVRTSQMEHDKEKLKLSILIEYMGRWSRF